MGSLPTELSDFRGRWTLVREIEDRRAGQNLRAEGAAVLYPADGQYIYDEEVTLYVPGQVPMLGTRRYLWRQEAARIAVHFEDGRFFHGLTLGRPGTQDHHDCAPDSYDVKYNFSGWPDWRVIWTVQGPRKSYVLTTEYCRASKTS